MTVKGDTMKDDNENGVARLIVSNDNDLPIEEMEALSEAFSKQATVVTMLVLTTPKGHALLTTKHREEKLVEYPNVGRELVRTLRKYADDLQVQIDLGMNKPNDGEVDGLEALINGNFNRRGGCDA